MKRLLEMVQIASGIVPVDLSAAANNGDWVSLKKFNRVAVVFVKAAGTAGDDPILTIQQAKDVAGTGAKALNFTRIDVKQGAQTGIGEFTKVIQAAGNTYTHADGAENQAIWVVEFTGDQLDVDNDFTAIQASVADVGANAQLGTLLYLLAEPRQAAEALPSAIVD